MDKNYFRCHSWLIYWHGRANKCENIHCTYPNPKRFEWALRKGFDYEKKIDNYMMLCPSCHRKYDITEIQRNRMSKARIGRPAKNKVSVILNDKEIARRVIDLAFILYWNLSIKNNNI